MHAAVDDQRGAGDEAGFGGGDEDGALRDLIGRAEAAERDLRAVSSIWPPMPPLPPVTKARPEGKSVDGIFCFTPLR